MRGVSRLLTIQSDERGASLALVALSLTGILLVASLVVDVGHLRLIRQQLIPATDAAALAAAQELVDRPWDTAAACAAAGTYLTGNAPAAAMTGCEVVPFDSAGGRVSVAATGSYDATFANLVGGEDGSVGSHSTATWGPPLTVSGLRPLALCYDGSLDLRQLIDEPPTSPTWVDVQFLKDDPAACGGWSVVGNFLTVDFESATGLHQIRHWMRDGYPGQVGFDGSTVASCDGEATCYQRPYALIDLIWQLASLVDSRSYVAFPVFDYADVFEVHLAGVVRARLYSFDLYGSAEHWSLQLKVEPGLIAGTCCGPAGIGAGNEVIAVCGVDLGAYQACEDR
jgi:Flp pilus assembly protein TadG